MGKFFTKFASKTAQMVGSYWAFLLAVLIIVVWALTGPIFKYSDTWQLVVNTGTTIITFLMVFLIQNTQNRDARAMHLKLDELINALKTAHNEMIDIEDLDDKKLEEIAAYYRKKKEECPDGEVAAIAKEAAEQTTPDSAERGDGDAAKEAADNLAKREAEDRPRRVA
jgi:low affinity Fe/Cu permease